tara:strand:+ start:317 stop:550 length:234 start_codon:yes stop_codon:yes gene_type:complete
MKIPVQIGDSCENKTAEEILDVLAMGSLKANFPDFVEAYGYESACEHMGNLFTTSWKKHRETIWQWYDQEYKGEKND